MGLLVQLDASPFAWFEDRGPAATLHGLIDDATSRPVALWFRPTEDLHGYLTVLGQTCRTYGLPVTLYGDRLNLFQRNDAHWTLDEQLQGRQDPTHFGRILEDLGIGFIAAQSPQAKGRIERLWGTLQDRLVSELRLRGISTIADANAFLPEFLTDFAPRFSCSPATPAPAWRPAPRDLDRVLSCRYYRIVGYDNTVHIGPRWIQIPPGPGARSYARCQVEVRELLDGRLLVFYQATLLATQPSPGPDFALAPRARPGETRARRRREQRQRRTALQRAVTALTHLARATAPTAFLPPASAPPANRERLRASRSDDQAGGRHLPTPGNAAPRAARVTASPPATRWRPPLTHPWKKTPITRRGRELQRT